METNTPYLGRALVFPDFCLLQKAPNLGLTSGVGVSDSAPGVGASEAKGCPQAH